MSYQHIVTGWLPDEPGQQEAGWYYQTTDGTQEGPYPTEDAARAAAAEDPDAAIDKHESEGA